MKKNEEDDFIEEVLTVSLNGDIADKCPLYDGEYERVKRPYRVKNFPIYKSKERTKGKWPYVYAKRDPNGITMADIQGPSL